VKSNRTESKHENRSTRKEEQTMKLASEKATPASRTTEVTIVMVPVGLFMSLAETARGASNLFRSHEAR